MNISVVRATKIDYIEGMTAAELESCLLPEGFPFLVNTDTQELIEPVFQFIWKRFGRTGNYIQNTALAHADDLRDWFIYLANFKVAWDQVDRADIETYRDLMFKLISPKTHQPYDEKTIARRTSTVVSFYRHFNRVGVTEVDVGDRVSTRKPSTDEVSLAHVRHRSEQRSNDIVPDVPDALDDEVRAMTSRQYRLIAQALGPLPEQDLEDTRPVRDRLWAELCVHTGLRPGEPEAINIYSILDLAPEDINNPHGLTFLRVLGKGRKWRKIELPNLLLKWLTWYIHNERKEAVAEGVRRGVFPKSREPTSLFVNGIGAKHNAGKPARYDSFNDSFVAALLHASRGVGQTAGLLKTVIKTDPESTQQYVEQEPAFTPHCLRHTFSVWTYVAEKQQGNPEPWKRLQALLGHTYLATTVNTYLRVADEFEAQLSDRITGNLAELLKTSL